LTSSGRHIHALIGNGQSPGLVAHRAADFCGPAGRWWALLGS
jgi:hypothetical protein